MILDHVGIPVRDFARSKEFYTKALEPLNYGIVMEVEEAAGFGTKGKPEFWIGEGEVLTGPLHVAFRAGSREQVRKFYEAAIAAGGKDTDRRGSGSIITPTTTGLSYSIPTVTTSRPSATTRNKRAGRGPASGFD